MIPRRPLLAASLLALARPALAQPAWPDRPVKVVVPYTPGGGLDALARALADRLTAIWQQSVVVENRPGAATITGTDAVAKAAPDGQTLLITSDASITANPHLYKALPYDPLRDLAPVTQLLDVHQMVIANPSARARDLPGFVAAAKAAPGRLNYASYGPGSQPHLLFEALKAGAGIDLVQVAYRGLPQAVLAVTTDEAQATLSGVASAGQQIQAGKLVALAVGKPSRLAQFPDVPTLAELGLADIDPRTWFGVFAPGGTPEALRARIRADIATALRDPAIEDRHLAPNGYTVHASAPADFAAFIRDDLAYKQRLIAISGAKVE
jgi:tripartite-type tricarboxylate transporter receptor subunit TctC